MDSEARAMHSALAAITQAIEDLCPAEARLFCDQANEDLADADIPYKYVQEHDYPYLVTVREVE